MRQEIWEIGCGVGKRHNKGIIIYSLDPYLFDANLSPALPLLRF